MVDEPTLTLREVAARLRVSEWTVGMWLRSGKLKGYRLGGTKAGWRIPVAEVDRYIAERKAESDRRRRGAEP